MVKDTCLIIPNFNQLSYLRNLVNQFHFYYPENKIYVVDNNSTYQPTLDYYWKNEEVEVHRYATNDFVGNLTHFLEKLDSEFYIISDADISITPKTPPFFLEVFQKIIESGVHHVGFDLISDNIPSWNPKAAWIHGDNMALRTQPYSIQWNGGSTFHGWKAPIDTTFAMYCKSNGGWSAPMPGEHWSNSVRIFEAFHLPFYEHAEHLNPERKNYYETVLKRDNTKPSAGRNHFNPFNGQE